MNSKKHSRSDATSEIVARAWDSASRSVDESKRQLLAKVAAAAITGDTAGALVDDIPLFVQTLDAVEAVHIELMAIMMTLVNNNLGVITWQSIVESPAGAGFIHTLDPILSVLPSIPAVLPACERSVQGNPAVTMSVRGKERTPRMSPASGTSGK